MIIKNMLNIVVCFSLIIFTISCEDDGGEAKDASASGSVSQSVSTFNTVLPESLDISPTNISGFVVDDGTGPTGSVNINVINNSEEPTGAFTAPIFSGPGASAFEVVNNTCISSIDSGQFCTFRVRFAPSTNGTFNAVVTINSATVTSNMTSLSGTASGFGTSPLLTGTCPASVDQDASYSCQLNSNDPDAGETYTWSFASGNTCGWAAINDSTGEITGSANDDQVGSCDLAVTVNDGTEDSNKIVSSVTVVNLQPTLVITSANLNEDSGLTEIQPDAGVQSNEEGFGVYSIVNSGSGDCSNNGLADIDAQNGAIHFTPNSNFSGVCNITVSFDDQNSTNNTVSSQFALTVNPINDLPVISQTCAIDALEGQIYNCIPTVSDIDGNGSNIWSLVAGNTCDWLSINSSTGELSGTPNDDQVGSCSLSFKVNDGIADSNEVAINISVANVAPTLSIADATIDEDASSAIIKSDSEVQSSNEGFGTYSLLSATNNDCSLVGTQSIDAANGEISYAPNAGFNGFCFMSVQFDDGNAVDNIVTSEFRLNVSPVNDAPVLTQACAATVNQDVNYNCAPTASDVDGDSLLYSFSSNNSCAWASINNSTGVISGTPNDDQVGSCNLEFIVSDGSLEDSSGLINVSVINQAPTLEISSANLDENSGLQIIKSDLDVQSNEEGFGVYSIATASNGDCSINGSVQIDSANGQVSFNPNTNYNGLCKINVEFNDENSIDNIVSAEFDVVVNSVNDIPVISQSCVSDVNQDLTYNCSPSAVDSDNNSFTWEISNNTSCPWLSIDQVSGAVSGTPNDDQVGVCTFDVKANDGLADSNILSIELAVNNVQPTLNLSDVSVQEDAPLAIIQSDINVAASDEGFGKYSLVNSAANDCSQNGNISIDADNGELSYSPASNFSGNCNISVKFDDENLVDNTVIDSFAVSVVKVNDMPVIAQSCAGDALQGSIYNCAPTVSDPDANDSHTWSFSANNSCNWLSIDAGTGVISGAPNDDEVGNCSLQFSVSDGGSNSSVEVVNVSVANLKPILEISDVEINEDSGLTEIASDSAVSASDEGFGKYSLLSSAGVDCQGKGTVNINESTGAISYMPNSNFAGSCNLNVQFNDENPVDNIVSASFSVTVKSVNDLASISHECGSSVLQDDNYSCAPAVIDPDSSDTHTWSLAGSNNCAWASINTTSGVITGQPNDDQVGNCKLGFKVNDGTTDSLVSIIDMTIVNKAPLLDIASTEVDEDSSLSVIRSNADVQSSEEGFGVYSLVTAAGADCSQAGSLSINSANGEVSFAPNLNYNGSCKVNVKFDDQNLANNTVVAEFFVDVNVVNDIPLISEACAKAINQDANYSCTPSVSDPDASDSHTWALSSANTCGHLSINSGTGVISGIANDDQVGNCDLGFIVNDGKVNSTAKLVKLAVNNVKPTLSISDASLSEDSPLTIIKSDSDVQSNEEGFGVYSLVLASGVDCSAKGQVTIKSANGEISYKPSANFNGICNVNVLFNDENSTNNFVTSQFKVEVNDNNTAPVVDLACASSVQQDGQYSCQPKVNDNNPEDSHTWKLASGNACAWVSIDEQSGVITGSPKDSEVGNCKLSVLANDGRVDSLAKDLIVEVINKKPTLNLSNVVIDEDSGQVILKSDTEVQASEEGDGVYSIGVASAADCSAMGLATINEDNGQITFRPETDINGLCNMAIIFDDENAENNIVTSQFSVNIRNVNDAPLIFATCKTKLNQDEPYECKPSILDLDENDKHGWAFSGDNTCDWLTISSSTGVMTGTPNDDKVGSCVLEFHAHDSSLYSEAISFNITIENIAPTLDIASVEVEYGKSLSLADNKVQASEEGFGVYSFESASDSDCQSKGVASVDEQNGSIQFSPQTSFSGECKLNVVFNDQNSVNNIAMSEFSVVYGEDPNVPVNTVPFFTLIPTNEHGYGGGEILADISAQEGQVASEDSQVVTVTVVSSSNLAVVPLENINVICEDLGDGCDGSVNVKSERSGASIITLEVSDGTLSKRESFVANFGSIIVENIYPVKNWNQYIKKTGPSKIDLAEIVECDNSSDKKYADGCIHAGESRKIELLAETSCFGLSLKDDLDAWEWVCDDSGSNVVFYTSGLLEDKGLSDIIENNKFMSNAVTLSRGCEVLAKSSPKIWDWTNPIKRLPSSSNSVVSLNEKGSIFVAESDMTGFGYSVEADEVALVIGSDHKFTFDSRSKNTCNRRSGSRGGADITAAVSASSQKYIWLEGEFKSLQSRRVTNMLNLVNVSYSRVQNLDTEHTKDAAYYLKDSHSNFLQNIRSNACYKHAVHLDNSKHNFIYNVKTSECGRGLIVENQSNNNLFMKGVLASNDIIRGDFTQGRGIFFKNNSDNNSLVKMAVLSSDRHSIMFENSNDQNTLSHITVANALSGGITIDANSNENSISSVVAMNTGKGIHMNNPSGGTRAQNNKFNDIYSVGNGNEDVSLEYVTGNTFHGNLYTSSNRCTLKGVSSNSAGMTGACKKDGLSTHAHFGGKSLDIFNLWNEEPAQNNVNVGRGLASTGSSHHGHHSKGKGHSSHGKGHGYGHYKHSSKDKTCSKYKHLKHKKVACTPRPKHDHKDMCEHKLKHDHGKHNGHHKNAKAYGYGKNVKSCHGHNDDHSGHSNGNGKGHTSHGNGHGYGNDKHKHHSHKPIKYCDESPEVEEEELMCLSPREERRIASLSGSYATGVTKFSSINNWHNFKDFFAGWQFNGGLGAPGSKHRASCDSSWHNCVATSLKPKASFQDINGVAEVGEACPASVDQSQSYDVVMTDKMETPYYKGIVAVEKIGNGNGICEEGETCNNQYIVNAVEIMFDGQGDDDGLCESGERCTYASTLGAHQEFGNYEDKTCAFTNGRVKDVKMFVYK